jgi:hypothetical protein
MTPAAARLGMVDAMPSANGIWKRPAIVDQVMAAILFLLACAHIGHRMRIAWPPRERQGRRSAHLPRD